MNLIGVEFSQNVGNTKESEKMMDEEAREDNWKTKELRRAFV